MPNGYDFTNTITGKVIAALRKLFAIEAKLEKASYDVILKVRQAINYLINQEPKIREYLNDGRIEISTNTLERAIKTFTIGRKIGFFKIHHMVLRYQVFTIV